MIPTSFTQHENGTKEQGLPENPEYSGTMELLMDVELPVLVRFGRTRMPLSELMKMKAGSVIEFGPTPENAVELVVNGRVIARGVAVAIQGNYGVRISEIVAARENLEVVSGLRRPDTATRKEQ
jgi:flagellar motor switch protein FliN